MPSQSFNDAAFFAMVRTSVLMRRIMEPFFSGYGLSGAQWGVLRALQRAESEGYDSIRVTELSGRLLIRIPSVTVVVARLAREGLVHRDVSPNDHRARELRLTNTGRQLVERIMAGHQERVETLLSPLATGEREQLATLLGRVADHLEVLTQTETAAGDLSASEQRPANAGRCA
jgi:DNA-binding MarR family transcriptional regulator